MCCSGHSNNLGYDASSLAFLAFRNLSLVGSEIMLLRRITRDVKDQNWTAVGIDFLIVVVGVFIGIQVANWNDERQDRVDEVYYLERILNDIDDSIANNALVIDYLGEKTRNTYWVVEKLRDGQLQAGEEELFKNRFLAIGDWQTGDFIDSTLQELQSSGRLGIIRSKAFREQLGRFELTWESIRRAQRNLADFHKALILQINARVDRGRTADFREILAGKEIPRIDLDDFVRQQVLLTPFEQLVEDDQLIRYLERYAEFYYWRRDNVVDLQDELATLREQAISALDGSTT